MAIISASDTSTEDAGPFPSFALAEDLSLIFTVDGGFVFI